MTLGDWIILIFAAGFFGVMVFALMGFVIRIFKEAKPYQNKVGKTAKRHNGK